MDYDEFLKYSQLPEHLKIFEIWLEWIGFYDYYYWCERYGEGDSIKYADEMIINRKIEK
jgi:hypothetical protein